MKRQFTYLLIAMVYLNVSSTAVSAQKRRLGKFQLEQMAKGDPDAKQGTNKAQLIKEALDWRNARLKDENGDIKPSYFFDAHNKANALQKMNHASRAVDLNWEELGPGNVGGRTRAVLLDKRDPNRKTLYIGSVGGGLWKSKDNGSNWKRLTGVRVNSAISCIAQDKNGLIYFGTGEGLSQPSGTSKNSGQTGQGLFTLDANDSAISIPSTVPAFITNTDVWSMINRIAINPTNENDIYVATSGGPKAGLQHSIDGGLSWVQIGSAAAPVGTTGSSSYDQAADVKFGGKNGNYIYASVGQSAIAPGIKIIVSTDGGATWDYKAPTLFPQMPGSLSRIEVAASASNELVCYIAVSYNFGDFAGVWKTSNGGVTWSKIGSKGSNGILDPYGTNNQGWYDNVIAVNPFNEDQVFLGGTTLYAYSSQTGWYAASLYNGVPNDPQWIHADEHNLTFSDVDSNILYIGCDGGLFYSSNASSNFPNPTYRVKNKNYSVTQMYGVAADRYGNVLGGAQDNGTSYINFALGGLTYAKSVYGGDGVLSEISMFDPNIFIGGYVLGDVHRSNNKGTSWGALFDNVIDKQGSGTYPSTCNTVDNRNELFVSSFWLSETKNAYNSAVKIKFIANRAYSAGESITLTSHCKQDFQEVLTSALAAGDSILVTDRLHSRLYFSSSCGLWMTPDILDFSGTPRWFRITNTSDDPLSVMASSTGDTIYIGSRRAVTVVTGINSITRFYTDSVGNNNILIPTANIKVNQFLSGASSTNLDPLVQGVAVDRNNSDHAICTVAGFKANYNKYHVFETTNGGKNWRAIDSNGVIPNMPVYDCVIDNNDDNHYIIGSELGVWDSYDRGVTWSEQNKGIDCRVPVYRLRQITYLSDECAALYIGTHGRGMWRCTTLLANSSCQVRSLGVNNINAEKLNEMNIYPNPAINSTVKVDLTLQASTDVAIRIIDISGRLLKEVTLKSPKAGSNTTELDVSNISNGMYVIVATPATGVALTRTLIVNK